MFPEPYNLNDFIINFEECYKYIIQYISTFMTYLFDNNFREKTENDNVDWLAEAVTLLKDNYYKCKESYKNSYNEILSNKPDTYCNPYKNIYLYCLYAYLRDYYSIDIPDIIVGEFYELKNFDFEIEEKPFYSLSDIAEIYCKMSGLNENELNKVKKRIQKEYSKLPCLKKYKNCKGHYKFNNIYFPLFMYVYYKKKNHLCCHKSCVCTSYLIDEIYIPLLYGTINKKEKELNIYKSMRDFIHNAYMEHLNVLDDEYLVTMIEQLKYACSIVPLYRTNARIAALERQ